MSVNIAELDRDTIIVVKLRKFEFDYVNAELERRYQRRLQNHEYYYTKKNMTCPPYKDDKIRKLNASIAIKPDGTEMVLNN